MTFDLAQRIRDEFPGTPDDEIPGLIRMLRMNRPDDQLRIERNYYRTLSIERGEEALIWRRRFEGPTLPAQNLFADLEARVSAAAAQELHAFPARKPAPVAASTPPQIDTLPALELQAIRKQLGFSQMVMAHRMRIGVAKLGQYEHGAPVPPEFLRRAREQLL